MLIKNANKIQNYIFDIFGVDSRIFNGKCCCEQGSKQGCEHEIKELFCNNLGVIILMFKLCNTNYKNFLPTEFYCTNTDYVNGLLDGIVNSNQKIFNPIRDDGPETHLEKKGIVVN